MPQYAHVLLTLLDRLRADSGRILRNTLRKKPELLESRFLLNAAPIEFGAVYVEQDLGSDSTADTIELSFVGGAPGTQLTRIEINGDKHEPGLSLGDILFDTEPGGLGADLPFAAMVTTRSGDSREQIQVEDGNSKLVLSLDDFVAGDQLTLSVDVDEVLGFDPDETDPAIINEDLDAITSGAEFQGVLLTAFFSAPHYHDMEGTAEFRNHYDPLLEATQLDLPRDDQDGNRDRTAGTAGELTQTPLPVSISGRVFEDRNGDLHQDAEDPGIADVEIELFVERQGEYLATGHKTTTNGSGDYSFDTGLNLMPGVYQLREAQPDGYFDVGAILGQVDGVPVGSVDVLRPNLLTEIDISKGGLQATEYNFAEALPASLSGRVHLSTPEGDCFGEEVEHQPVIGATVLLLDQQGEVVAETSTDAEGRYEFTDLRSGEYSIVEITPAELIDGGVHVGQVQEQPRGQAGVDRISQITLLSGDVGEDYDFCDHRPASLSGHVYHDRNNDGLRDANEEGIARAVLSLLDEEGSLVETVETDADGRYEFQGVRAGSYRVIELQPDHWLDGRDRAGSINGRTVGEAVNPGDEIRQIKLLWGDEAIDYDFGELRPTSLSGRVHLSDPDGNCFGIDEELLAPVAGAIVQLLDATGQVLDEATTAADGTYEFSDLAPGVYGIRELTPAALLDGGAHTGRVGDEARGRVSSSGDLVDIRLDSDENGTDFDFCEHRPATLSGYVYSDRSDDGVRDPSESPISNVTVQLRDGSGDLVAETETDTSGQYVFERLRPDNYSIREIHPLGWIDGTDTAGTVGGSPRGEAVNPGDEIRRVRLQWGDVGEEYNFAELQPASLSGFVHTSGQEDCWNDNDARPLAGVTIRLLDDSGRIVLQTETDTTGRYEFNDIAPGQYSVEQLQPDSVFQGSQRAGSGGGDASVDNLISQIDISVGEALVEYDFCEVPPSTLSGFVFQDGPPIPLASGETLPEDLSGIRDGRLTPDDKRLGGVVLELRRGLTGEPVVASEALPGTYEPGPIRTTTDKNGFYEFTGLRKGNYAVYERQPDGYLDGIDTPGSTDGIAINPLPAGDDTIFLETVTSMLVEPPRNDAIVRIGLPPGMDSQWNNFSEVLTTGIPTIPAVIPPPDPTPLPPRSEITLPPPPPQPPRRDPPPLVWVIPPVEVGPGVQANTWHLSIIDGGQPRLARANGEASFHFSASSWHQQPMRDGRWYLGVSPDAPGPSLATFDFGMHDAHPIAGDFNGDGITEIGIFHKGFWFIDLNGNGRWDGQDLWARMGHDGDLPVTGDWDGDGKDDIGVFGRAWPGDPRAVESEPGLPDLENVSRGERKNMPPREQDATLGRRVMKLTAQGRMRSDVIDHVFLYGTAGDRPVAGDWNGDGIDTVGVFRDGNWKLDVDGDGRWNDTDLNVQFGQRGDLPVVGDFNGDGIDDLAIFRDGVLYIDANGNRRLDSNDLVVERDDWQHGIPVVGNWTGGAADGLGWYEQAETHETVVARRLEAPTDNKEAPQ